MNIKKLVEQLKRQTGCDIKFIEPYSKGQKVIFEGKICHITEVISPSEYVITLDGKPQEVQYGQLTDNNLPDQGNMYPEVTIDSVVDMLKKHNFRCSTKIKGNNCLITGEYDYNEFSDMTNKIKNLGFLKGDNVIRKDTFFTYYMPDGPKICIKKP